MRRPGSEPGSTAWKAVMLTIIIPPTLVENGNGNIISQILHQTYALSKYLKYQIILNHILQM